MEINLAWTWYVLVGAVVCCAVGYATSRASVSFRA
jgi:hypothetical protein